MTSSAISSRPHAALRIRPSGRFPRALALLTILLPTSSVLAHPSPRTASSTQLEADLGWGIALPVTFSRQDPAALPVTLPLRLEIGLRFPDGTFFGLLGEYVIPSDMSCCCAADPGTCTIWTARVGLEFQYHFADRKVIHPWLGLGAGLELTHLTASGDFGTTSGDATVTSSGSGWFGEVQLGVDVPVGETFHIGPWLQFSLGSLGGSFSAESSVRGRVGFGLRFGVVL